MLFLESAKIILQLTWMYNRPGIVRTYFEDPFEAGRADLLYQESGYIMKLWNSKQEGNDIGKEILNKGI